MNRRRLLLTALGGPSAMCANTPYRPPAGATDCHTHIFGDPKKYPFSAQRTYTPPPAGPERMEALLGSLGMDRVVIVTPSVYGTDNRATLFGMKALGKRARGIAVIASETTDAELDALAKAGVRGIRLNLATAGINDPAQGRARFAEAARRMKARGWHIQIYTTPRLIRAIRPIIEESPVPVVFDHFGGAVAADGPEQEGFGDLVAMVRSGAAHVKISGAYRASSRGPDYPDTAPLARLLIAANPDRVVWGTDWPHPDSTKTPGRKPTDISPELPINDRVLLDQLPLWAPDEAVQRKILVETPARLYGF